MSEESQVTAMHSTQYWTLRCMSYKLYKPKPWLIALVQVPFIVPIKADLQAHACLSEYHDEDRSLMLIKDARSDDYAPGTLGSEEWARPTEVGSRNRQSLSLLIMTNDNGNCIAT